MSSIDHLSATLDPNLLNWEDFALVRVDGGFLEVAPFAIRWEGHEPRVHWREDAVIARVPADTDLTPILEEAKSKRLRSFRRCTGCGVLTAPEHREGQECHGCMERRGVVF